MKSSSSIVTRLFPYLLLAFVILNTTTSAYAQRLAVKTDVAKLALTIPNIEAELVTSRRTSLSIGTYYGFQMYGMKDAEFFGIQPEFRYWYAGQPMIREYVGVGALMMRYDFTCKHKRYKADCIGIGGTFGYAYLISPRWNIEGYFGFGLVEFSQRQYLITDKMDDVLTFSDKDTHVTGYRILPTKIGISLSYILR